MAKQWTLASAEALFPDVRERTARAVVKTDALVAQRDELPVDSVERAAVEEEIEAELSRWMREMEALGLDIAGIWHVDFDTGSGYLCWKWPEERLAYFHTREDGFAGRTPIQ
ncbi:MAG: DUF2203 family protein [bacterium]|nr:DUF2203 family protein [bacterium]MCP5066630.1 DUF2203 family protein [bacterium]